MKGKERLKLLNVIALVLVLGFIVGSLRDFSQSTVRINTVGKGEVQPVSGVYKKGREIKVMASSKKGWRFDHWEGDLIGTDNSMNVVLDNDIEAKAVFINIAAEKERKRQAKLQKKKEAEERKRLAKLQKKREAEEQKRKEEEKQRRLAELKRKKEAEERKRLAKLQKKREAEEQKKKEEEKQRRLAELKRKKEAEERKRLAELEKKEWEITFGEDDEDVFKSIDRTSDGGYILAGWTESFGAKGEDAYVVKVNHFGEEQWSQLFGGDEWDRFYSVQETSDGGYILAGYSTSFGEDRDGYVVKLDKEGQKEWSKTFGKDKADNFEAVKEARDGGYILVGSTSGVGIGLRNAYLVKVNRNGEEKWSRTLRMKEGNELYAIELSSDGGLIVAGYSGDYGNYQGYIAKLSSTGKKLWSKEFGGAKDEKFYAIEKLGDNGYLLAGWTESFGRVNKGAYLVKVDEQGNEKWARSFKEENWNLFSDVRLSKDGGIITVGEKESSDAKGRSAYVVKLDSAGQEEWQKLRGTEGQDAFEEVEVIDDDYLILVGFTESEDNNLDGYLVKVNLN